MRSTARSALAGVLLLLAVSLAPAAPLPDIDDWIEVRTEHFTLFSNAGERRTSKIAVQLERFRLALGRITQGFELDSQVPTSIFIFANDSAYGLAAGVWTRDVGKAHFVAKELQAGTVWVNTYNRYDSGSPFGGYKQSGFGRDLGYDAALEKYTQTKSVWVAVEGP